MCPIHDHTPARTWRHLDTCQYRTLLHAGPPRVRCEEYGVRQVVLPWAEAKSQFTLLFERFAIDMLKGDRHREGRRHPAHQLTRP
ncbi:MAG: transposase family protein [Sandaracinaceae bacterium]|nr:transposase family protein [Sandaracinaceae bacterium]